MPAALIMELKLIEVGLVLLKSRVSIKAARFHWLLVSAAAIEPQQSLVITTSYNPGHQAPIYSTLGQDVKPKEVTKYSMYYTGITGISMDINRLRPSAM